MNILYTMDNLNQHWIMLHIHFLCLDIQIFTMYIVKIYFYSKNIFLKIKTEIFRIYLSNSINIWKNIKILYLENK